MKIKNDSISIRIGKKQYDFRNLILDEYLKKFINLSEEEITKVYNSKNLRYLLIKFDKPIENINKKSLVKNEEFDIAIINSETEYQEISDTKITTQYNYQTIKNFSIMDYNTDTTISNDISQYYGKKIAMLGFNTYFSPSKSMNNPVKAILDTSNYDIYLQENQDFTVTRKDIVTTDALFYSNNKIKVPGPIHLAPIPNNAVITPNTLTYESDGFISSISGENRSYGIIYSVGLSSYTDRIDKEFIIGQDIEVMQNETELDIKGIENYLSNENKLYPNSNMYPSSNVYPIKSNYKYIIIKYKVWQNILSGTYENPVYTMTDTGFFYYQAIPIDKFGKLNMKIKYERG